MSNSPRHHEMRRLRAKQKHQEIRAARRNFHSGASRSNVARSSTPVIPGYNRGFWESMMQILHRPQGPQPTDIKG